jgi:plastocyanin
MRYARALFAVCAVAVLASCTPGAPPPPAGSGAVPGAVIINVSLLTYAPKPSVNGIVAGYNSDALTVPVGTVIQFHNQDSFTHTGSFLGTNGFPSGNPLKNQARTRSGTDLSQAGWSTGDLSPNAYSQPLTASRAGTYYYGCFFHYPTPMRGWITVR